MEKDNILQQIATNIKDMEKNEKDLAMLLLAVHEKSKKILKNKKIEEIQKYLESQANFYSQEIGNYNDNIQKILKNYTESMDYVFYFYDELLTYIYKQLTQERNKQKIEVSNIVSLHEKIIKEGISSEQEQILQLKINASANKKLNYTYIIDELYERQKWCISQLELDIEEIFKVSTVTLPVYNPTMIDKIKNWFSNKFFGKKKYAEFLDNYERKMSRTLKNSVTNKKVEIATIMGAIENQIADAERQMGDIYNSMLQVA